ncbi:MAG: hypothetical protein HW412_1425, partial [Bacteroidetes bacterium]|nr:hypothetical protein [Bacteroidota bacterium]
CCNFLPMGWAQLLIALHADADHTASTREREVDDCSVAESQHAVQLHFLLVA